MIVRPSVARAMMRARVEHHHVLLAKYRRDVIALRFATLDLIAAIGITACWVVLWWCGP